MKISKGFTLIELLVVIAIIGILSSVVLSSLNSARAKARDAKRKMDLHSLELAVQLYYSTNGTYPDNAAGGGIPSWPSGYQAELTPYIPSLPLDPNNEGWRYYGSYRMTWAPDPNCNGQYVLWAYLEGGNAAANTCGFGSPHYFILLGSY
jgi:type II secretion system protein G